MAFQSDLIYLICSTMSTFFWTISLFEIGIKKNWKKTENVFETRKKWYIFCYQIFSDLLWERIVLVIQKNFWINYWDLETCRKTQKNVIFQFQNGKLDIGGAGKWHFLGFWLMGFSKKNCFLFFPNENQLGFHMRYHLFLHYLWNGFFRILEKTSSELICTRL